MRRGGDGSGMTDEALCRYELDMRLLQVRAGGQGCWRGAKGGRRVMDAARYGTDMLH